MIPPVIVTIYGNVSAGKSPWAREIAHLARAEGHSVFVSDHRLFSFAPSFLKDLALVREQIASEKPDFAIVVIGTGLDSNPPFKIEVEHKGFGAFPLFDLIFGGPRAEPC